MIDGDLKLKLFRIRSQIQSIFKIDDIVHNGYLNTKEK